MKKQKRSFIDKVYDTYLSDDFKVGIDNLNPIRELAPTDAASLDDQIAEVYAALAKRVAKLKEDVSTIIDEEPEKIYTGNSKSETNAGKDDSKKNDLIKQVGGTKDKLVAIPSMEDDTDPLSLELELMILQLALQSSLGDDSDGQGQNNSPKKSAGEPDELPFDCDCDDETKELKQTSRRAGQDGGAGGGSTGGSSAAGEDDSSNDSSEDGGDGNSGGSKDDKDETKGDENEPQTFLSNINDAIDDALAEADKASRKNEATMRQCALAEIGFLKAILAVLKIIKMVKKMLDPLLGIIMEAIQIVQLAAGCWINPTNIAVLIQRIMQVILAIVIGLVASLLSQLWALLGLDCLTAQTQQLIDEIKEALAAIGGIIGEFNPTGIIMDMSTVVGAVADKTDSTVKKVKNLKDEFKDSLKQTEDGLKETIKTSLGLTDEDFEDFMGSSASRQRALGILKKTAPQQASKIEAMVNQVLSLYETIEPIVEKSKGYANVLPAGQQLIASFKKFKKIGKDE